MAKQYSGLGRGLGALLDEYAPGTDEAQNGITELNVNLIDPNREQPRKRFSDAGLRELAESIKSNGIIQPLVVSKNGDRYIIVAGERRWRAARLAGLDTVPVVVRDYASSQLMEIALIENLQREDLNPIEEAMGYRLLMEQHSYTQEQVAHRIGKSRPAVANALRLLTLSQPVMNMLQNDELTAGHAKAIAAILDETEQLRIAERIRDEKLSVREAEELCKSEPLKKRRPQKQSAAAAELMEAMRDLETRLGTRVRIVGTPAEGKIVVNYYSAEQLQELYEQLMQV